MALDKSPLVLDDFKGLLWTDRRENSLVKIPFQYAYNCRNLEFTKKGGLRSRHGINRLGDLFAVTGTAIQFWKIDNLNGVAQSDRWLIHTWDGVSGRLYDTGVTAPATNPVLTLTGMKYTFAINAFGRMYITPWSAWATPLYTVSECVYLYNGKYNARKTQFTAPSVGTFAVSATAGGSCTPGLHYFSIMFETDSGFISTQPVSHYFSPLSVTTTTANATAHLTNIPTWAGSADYPQACIVARHIIMSKVAVNPPASGDGGFHVFEPFIVQTINDNSTTTADISVPDSGLVDTAKNYLEEGIIGIRPCVSMAVYNNRMVYMGFAQGAVPQWDTPNRISYSLGNRPEQLGGGGFGIDSNSVIVGVGFSGKVMTGQEMNGTFYIFKEDSTFSHIEDPSVDPIEWAKPKLIDSGRGAYPFGICSIGNNLSAVQDGYMLVAGNHGISLFSGVFATTPITEGLWEGFNKNDVIWTKITVDPIRKQIFFRTGDPNSNKLYGTLNATNFYVYHGNYYYGLDLQSIRWSIFEFGNNEYGDPIVVRDINMRQNPLGGPLTTDVLNNYYVILDDYNGNALFMTETLDDKDNGPSSGTYPIWIWESGLTDNEAGEVYHFGPLKLRITGLESDANNATIQARGLDGSYTTLATWKLSQFPSKYYNVNLSKDSEHLQVKITGQCKALIERLIIDFSKLQLERPRL